jgi:GT2 family glycosyltransferase
VGPKLLNEDGTTQSSRRRFPTLASGIFESTWLEGLAPRKVLSRYYYQDVDDSEITEVDWVTGAALVVRREVIDKVGVFDPGFFMYSEEVDWQRRIKSAGWRITYLPQAQVVHYGGKSSDQVTPLRHIRFQTSKIRYFRKHHGVAAAAIVRLVILLNYVWQLGVETLKGLLGHKRNLRRERVSAYWQVLRSGLRSS